MTAPPPPAAGPPPGDDGRTGTAPTAATPSGDGRAPRRVRVTSSRRGAPVRAARPVALELDEQTVLGDVYLEGLMRAQLRLALGTLALGAVGLGGLPVLFLLVPATRTLAVAGVPLPWLVLGVLVYPAALAVARSYVRASERIEAQFTDVVGRT